MIAGLPLDALGPLLLALGGLSGFAGLIQVVFQRRKFKREAEKTGADATQVIASTASGLLVAARTEITELQQDRDELREDFDYAMEAMATYIDVMSVHVYALEKIIRDIDPSAVIPAHPPRPRLRRPRSPRPTTP